MKFSATIPMIAIPMVILNFPRFRKSTESLVTRKLYVFSMAIAILVRCFVTMLLNYYWAIPVMFGLSPNEVPGNFNWFFWGNPMSSNPLIYYILGVSIWNTWQGAVDAIVSWFIVYPTKLYKQYKWR
jgi:riboflavin transporter FmnP